MTEKVSFVFKKKKFSVDARKCGFFSFGLMFRTRQTELCVFRFKEDTDFRISSLFVPFSFLAIWLDEENKVMGVKKVRPFTVSVSSNKPYRTLLEIPINKKHFKLVNILMRGLLRR